MSNGFHALVSLAVFAAMVSWAGIHKAMSAGDPKLSASAESPVHGRKILLRSGKSHHELYRVSLSSVGALPPLNTMHHWRATLVNRDGAPVTGAEIAFIGGLRDRPHPLPSSPRMTRDFGDGRYLIEGVKFDRHGW